MKNYTANAIVQKMLSGNKIVKLRGNKRGGISKNTWNAICDELFNNHNAHSINATYDHYMDKSIANIIAKNHNNETILIASAILY